MSHRTVAEDQAEKRAAQRWENDQSYRNEFVGDRAACLAFARAEARGAVRIHGGGNVQRGMVAPEPKRDRAAGFVDAAEAYERAAYAPASHGVDQDLGDDALKRRWDQDAALRAEFADAFDAYVAYTKAVAGGRVKILGKPTPGRRDVADTAAAPIAAPAAAAPAAAPAATVHAAPIAASVRRGQREFASFEDFYTWRRSFAKDLIARGKITEAQFRANMQQHWNELVATQGRIS